MDAKKISPTKSVLGRGLNALLQDSPLLRETSAASGVQTIAIEQIEPNPFQPRKDFDPETLQELTDSIEHHGIIQPLTVRKLDEQKYQLIAGERRLKAAKLAGLKEIPVYIRMAEDQQLLEMALVENIQRANLNPIEIALSYQRLMHECKIKQETLGERVGKNRATVTNYLRLLKLPMEVQLALKEQKISMGHARAIINAEAEVQRRLLKEIIAKELSVRQVEARVSALGTQTPTAPTQATTKNTAFQHVIQDLNKKLTTRFNAPVKIHTKAREKGEIKITFTSAAELHRIVKLLSL